MDRQTQRNVKAALAAAAAVETAELAYQDALLKAYENRQGVTVEALAAEFGIGRVHLHRLVRQAAARRAEQA
jgi:transcriptional regulator of acetoin/glycerol metabolism